MPQFPPVRSGTHTAPPSTAGVDKNPEVSRARRVNWGHCPLLSPYPAFPPRSHCSLNSPNEATADSQASRGLSWPRRGGRRPPSPLTRASHLRRARLSARPPPRRPRLGRAGRVTWPAGGRGRGRDCHMTPQLAQPPGGGARPRCAPWWRPGWSGFRTGFWRGGAGRGLVSARQAASRT